MYAFNDTEVDYSKSETLSSLFERQCALNGQGEALRQDGLSMTYDELNARSNQVGHYLQSLGLSSGQPVGLQRAFVRGDQSILREEFRISHRECPTGLYDLHLRFYGSSEGCDDCSSFGGEFDRVGE